MPLAQDQQKWLHSEELNYREAVRGDSRSIRTSGINAWRDIIVWDLPSPTVANDLSYWRYTHCQHGLAVEMRVAAKTAGAGSATFQVRVNGVALAAVTVVAVGLTTLQISSALAKLSNTDKLTVDMTAGSGWALITVEIIVEPTMEVA